MPNQSSNGTPAALTALRWLAVAGVLACGVMTSSASAGPLQLHPRGTPLPTNQQGPFITTGDGGVLCIDAQASHHSLDEGRTWKSAPLFRQPERFQVSSERALLRTRKGTVISAWMNMKELAHTPGFKWGGPPEEFEQWILPTYVCRSLDDGHTWEEPQLLHRPWCGCIHSILQTKSGRIVLVGQTIIPAWRHATVMYVSDDEGVTWKKSNILDYGVGRHDHAGSCEATILERGDGSLTLLIRTESGFFFESESRDDGLTWVNLKKSPVPSVTCCGQMARLADGRAALLWNHPPRSDNRNGTSREELSLAFSSDDGQTWTERTVIAARYPQGEGRQELRVSYPYLYERRPGELWITTMQGDLRLKIHAAEVPNGSIPVPGVVAFFGDSTTAFRPGAVKEVVSVRIGRELRRTGHPLVAVNRGVGGHTTADALNRYAADIQPLPARLVVVQFGINDSAVDVWQKPPATAPRVSEAQFRANLRGIAEKVRGQGAKVILATTNPVRWTPKLKELYGKPPYDVNADDGFERPCLSRYNAVTRAVAAEMGVPLLDVHQLYETAARERGISVDSLLLDGMHPNDTGHEITAGALFPLILSALQP